MYPFVATNRVHSGTSGVIPTELANFVVRCRDPHTPDGQRSCWFLLLTFQQCILTKTLIHKQTCNSTLNYVCDSIDASSRIVKIVSLLHASVDVSCHTDRITRCALVRRANLAQFMCQGTWHHTQRQVNYKKCHFKERGSTLQFGLPQEFSPVKGVGKGAHLLTSFRSFRERS